MDEPTPVFDTLFVDFNDDFDDLFTALHVGDVVWADDAEGMRAQATITAITPCRDAREGCVIIRLKGDEATLEDWDDGHWVRR